MSRWCTQYGISSANLPSASCCGLSPNQFKMKLNFFHLSSLSRTTKYKYINSSFQSPRRGNCWVHRKAGVQTGVRWGRKWLQIISFSLASWFWPHRNRAHGWMYTQAKPVKPSLLEITQWAAVPYGNSPVRLAMITWIIRWILLMIIEASIVTDEIPGSSELFPVFCFFSSSTCRNKPDEINSWMQISVNHLPFHRTISLFCLSSSRAYATTKTMTSPEVQ